MTSDVTEGKRHEKRDSLFLSAVIKLDGYEPFTTRVRNLSAGGMMIDSAIIIPADTRLTAEVRGVGEIRGLIAWSTLGRAGVSFDMDIDPRMARSSVGAPKSTLPTYLKPIPSRRTGLRIR